MMGPDHPDTLIARNNLATAYHDEACSTSIPLLAQNLADSQRILGPTTRTPSPLATCSQPRTRTRAVPIRPSAWWNRTLLTAVICWVMENAAKPGRVRSSSRAPPRYLACAARNIQPTDALVTRTTS